ncbi:hypothetical protein ACH5RR_016928 [Cinchona calisaya]|uniref:Bifunctional inhibitor/plant lipid transfer protein/seed storage helical domain-containing protein n=1 Tax=Cinchona calisaya TaxID=153742 RepID=A0ABD2ZXF2_9GENT
MSKNITALLWVMMLLVVFLGTKVPSAETYDAGSEYCYISKLSECEEATEFEEPPSNICCEILRERWLHCYCKMSGRFPRKGVDLFYKLYPNGTKFLRTCNVNDQDQHIYCLH